VVKPAPLLALPPLPSLPGLRRLFADGAPYDPQACALVCNDGASISYASLAAAVEKAAQTLAGLGAGPSGAVGVAEADPCGFLVAALAVWECGAALLPLDTRPGAPPWEPLATRSRARIVVSEAGSDGALSVAFPEPSPSWAPLDPRCGLLLFTSGSSGPPKGVLLGRAGLAANVDAILGYLPIRAAPRTAIVLPLVYGYALVGQALAGLRAGGTLSLLSEVRFPAQQLEAMARDGVQGLSSVPVSLRLLARTALELRDEGQDEVTGAIPRLSYAASAGAPLDAATCDLLRRAFPQARLFNQYGLTEASPRVAYCGDDHPRFAEGALLPLTGITLAIDDGLGHPLPAGEEGHLLVRGPSAMLGYLDDLSATQRALRHDGALVTGDFGRLDADGCLFVSGRADGVVKVAGERVGVEGVAETLRSAPAVHDAVVVALPDEALGARLFGFVEGDAGAADQARLAARQLSPAKRPAQITQLEKLPRTANGKADLAAMRELAERARPGRRG
jgi:long-chain acyl-CoA synthetase